MHPSFQQQVYHSLLRQLQPACVSYRAVRQRESLRALGRLGGLGDLTRPAWLSKTMSSSVSLPATPRFSDQGSFPTCSSHATQLE
jgi:hypothetical protein